MTLLRTEGRIDGSKVARLLRGSYSLGAVH
jgi:hypothetical protein